MRGTITKINEQKSYMGGIFWYFFFKMEDGKSARSCVYKTFGNSARWIPLIDKFKAAKAAGQELALDGLNLRGRMVDADSFFSVVKQDKIV